MNLTLAHAFPLWPHLGQALLCAVLLTYAAGIFIWKRWQRLPSRLLVAALSLLAALLCVGIPLKEGTTPAFHLFGLWGELSLTTLQCLALTLWHYHQGQRPTGWLTLPPASCSSTWAWGVIAGLSVPLYLSALGLFPLLPDWDAYASGYQPYGLLIGMALTGAACLRWAPGWSVILSVDLLAYAFDVHESSNLWDVLLDPLIALYAVHHCGRHIYQRVIAKLRQKPCPADIVDEKKS